MSMQTIESRTTTPRRFPKPVPNDDDHYDVFLASVRARYAKAAKAGPLFLTNADGLWDLYLDAAPSAEDRQYRNCNACRHFIERYGSAVSIDDAGNITSALWDPSDAPAEYASAAAALKYAVEARRVSDVLIAGTDEIGHGKTNEWTHFSVRGHDVHASLVSTPGQRAAERREEHHMLCRALGDYDAATIGKVVALFDGEQLTRAEKHVEMAKWLLAISEARGATKNQRLRDHIVWRAVGKAPPGWCHVRSGLIGTVLDDVAAGLPVDDIKRKHADKMSPVKYLRPQAAPTGGQIDAAEKLVEKLGIAQALKRRFARLDDCELVWRPKAIKTEQEAGVFSALRGGSASQFAANAPGRSPVVITWAKFERTILPNADQIACVVPGSGDFCALVTASDPEAPPILQWDRADKRNPVSWYVYSQGSAAVNWRLQGGHVVDVTGIAHQPNTWNGTPPGHHGDSIVVMLTGAVDTRDGGLALFPECLKSELHAVRSTIEAHSIRGKLEGRAEASACGLRITDKAGATLMVTSRGVTSTYKIDRLE